MKKVVLGVGLAVLASAWTALGQGQFPPARVVVEPIVQREMAAGQTFVSTVMPLRASVIGSAANGRVEQFLVNEGDRVAKGKPLAKLRTGIIEAEVAAARGDLGMRQAELEELENGSRPEEIDQAKARLQGTEALMQMRRLNHERVRAARQAARPEELDEAIAMANQATAAHAEAKAALKLLEDGPRKERIAQARARVETAKAEVRRLEEQLERHTMYAPFDGYIVAEHAEVGQWVNQGAAVVEIVELDKVDIQLEVLEDYIAALTIGTPARVEIPALPTHAFTGSVALIVPRANLRARTFPVKVRVENRRTGDDVLLKAGMFARVTLPVGKKEQALVVSKDALVLGGPSPQLYVVSPGGADAKKGKVRPVVVQLGVADGNLIQVKGDVQAGQQVVVQGNERLRPGQDVQW